MCITNKIILILFTFILIILLVLTHTRFYYYIFKTFDNNSNNLIINTKTNNNKTNNNKTNNNNNNYNYNENFSNININSNEKLDENLQCPMYVYYNKQNYFMIFKNLPYRYGINPLVFNSLEDVKSKINELKCPTFILDSIVDSKNNVDVRDNYKYVCNRKVGENIYLLERQRFDEQYNIYKNKLEHINNANTLSEFNNSISLDSIVGMSNNIDENLNSNLNNDKIRLIFKLKYNSSNVDEVLDKLYKEGDTQKLYKTLKDLLDSENIEHQTSLDVETCQLMDMGKTLNMGESLYKFNSFYNSANINNETNSTNKKSINLNITEDDVYDVVYNHYISNYFVPKSNQDKIFS
jgi:hypothetical protein